MTSQDNRCVPWARRPAHHPGQRVPCSVSDRGSITADITELEVASPRDKGPEVTELGNGGIIPKPLCCSPSRGWGCPEAVPGGHLSKSAF